MSRRDARISRSDRLKDKGAECEHRLLPFPFPVSRTVSRTVLHLVASPPAITTLQPHMSLAQEARSVN